MIDVWCNSKKWPVSVAIIYFGYLKKSAKYSLGGNTQGKRFFLSPEASRLSRSKTGMGGRREGPPLRRIGLI
jgi:hypothetical protein